MVISKQNSPRWLIFLIDITICACSVILAYLLRFDFGNSPDKDFSTLPFALFYILSIRAASLIISKIYAGIVRHTNTGDSVKIFLTSLFGSLIFVLTNLITYYFINKRNFVPYSIVIIDFLATTFSLIAFRIFIKIIFLEVTNPTRHKTNVIIFGAGASGLFTKKALDRDAGVKYKVFAFIDDDPKKFNKTLEGVKIYSSDKLESLLAEENNINHVTLSIQNLSPKKKKEIIEICLAYNTKVLIIPPVAKWINGELSFKQIKKINIEDLLEREIIKLDENNIRRELLGSNILITGAAGSIGSELVRQIVTFRPNKLILVDQAETPLFHLELELVEKFRNCNYEIIIGDIRNKKRMEYIFETFKPNIVYHSAAYKHVPLMENNPAEAISTNIEGTKIIADLSVKYHVEKFVMISTDKAVNPTNIMGASKRIAEIYTQSLNQKNQTKFITTRFGNVLGSNGSVVELFKKQIAKGEPLTITHPNVTRFFMTIPEACQLVLEAGSMGKGGEIFIFDMGKPVKIVDLAKKMIKLSGLELGKDIQIVFTQLRPGEKLYEELLNDHENTLPTHHPLIMIAKVKEYDLKNIIQEIDELIALFSTQDNFTIVRKMKAMVPEFISNNSIFEQLDLKN